MTCGFVSDDQGCCTIIHAGGIACGDAPTLAEGSGQFRQLASGHIRAGVFVVTDDNRITLSPGNGDRRNLFFKLRRGCTRQCLRPGGKRVLIVSGYTELFGEIFGGLAHGLDAVEPFDFRIDETPANRRVLQLWRSRESCLGFAEHKWRARHTLDAARNNARESTAPYTESSLRYGFQPACAQAVDRDTGHALAEAGQQNRHARDIAIVLAGLIGATQHDFFHNF